jgi:hypothetical protein
MGCIKSKTMKWEPEDDDNNLAWMEDYDGMMSQMMKEDANPDQWELDLAREGLMNPSFDKPGDLKGGPHRRKRMKMWFKFKQAVNTLNGDRSEAALKTIGTEILGTSGYMQMRCQQWIVKVNYQSYVDDAAATTQGTDDDTTKTQSKYVAPIAEGIVAEDK